MKQNATIQNGKIIPHSDGFKQDLSQFEGKEVSIEIEKIKRKRTNQQNRALHLWFEHVAEQLNNAGMDMRKLIRPEVEISWTPYSVKEYLWRPLQETMTGKKSTTKLNTEEIDTIYEMINRVISERAHVHVPFPALDNDKRLEYNGSSK